MFVASGINMGEHSARVGVHGALDFFGPCSHPEVTAPIHPADQTRGQTARQTERPADELDVTTEGEVIRRGQGIHESLEHDADMIAGDERIGLGAHGLRVLARPCRMIRVDVEDVPRLGHLAIRQHAVLAHLLLDLLWL